nr:VanZ family protein [uncultured Caproiciproducens sp.]
MVYQCRKTGIKISPWHIALGFVFALILAVMLDFTGIPSIRFIANNGTITHQGLHIPMDEINLIPFHSLAADARPYLENILLFVPFGFLLPLIWEQYHPFRKTMLAGLSFSFVIEFSQLFDRRITDIDDLLMNTLGTLVGWLLWQIMKKCFSRIYEKISIKNTERGKLPFLLRHEAVFYMISAFFGMLFLYSPLL